MTSGEGRSTRTVALATTARALLSSSGMPPDVERRAAHRLGTLSLLIGAALLGALVVRRTIFAFGMPFEVEHIWLLEVANLIWATTAIAVWRYSRKSEHPGRVLLAGLVFEIFICWDLACIEELVFRLSEPPPRLSFITLVLLAFPLVIPATPRRRAITTGICLASLPAAFLLGRAVRGGEPFEVWMLAMYAPTVIAGGLAVVLARFVHRMNVQVAQARRMGSYELVEKLGAGGMGEVWRARHRMLVRPAAIKLVAPDALGRDAEGALARFEREAQATSVLRSPHTVQLYDFGTTDDGSFFYAMELLDGSDLETLVEEHGPMPANRVVHVLAQACRSLADAHDHGLVHRDIKPANLYLCRLGAERDYVKVLDFGLVKAGEGAAVPDANLSRENLATGTPAFMPPELAVGGEVDGRTDLYSLGCVGWYLLAGRLPFDGDNPMQVAMKHVTTAPTAPSEVSELEVPAALDALILQCMAKKREERPPNAAALFRELSNLDVAPWTEGDADRWWDVHAAGAGTI